MYIYWILLLAVSVTCDPFLIPLKGKEGPGIYTIYNVEGGGKLYLASNDANESLNKITLVTGTVNITLDQLYDFSDTPKFITVSDKVVLSNQNLDDVTDALTGYLYITTKQQADDPNFSVAVIKTNHTIVTTNANSTVVILNTALISDSDEIDKPLKTSRVTNINQSANTEFDFHWGIPAKNWTTITKNRFFENPILAANCYNNGTCTRFNNIEPLQINQDYWYLKSSGPLTMTIENKFVRTLNYTTTAFETTGIIVNNDVFLEHTVNFILDPTRERDAGVIVSTFIESNDTLIEFRLLDENGGEIEMSLRPFAENHDATNYLYDTVYSNLYYSTYSFYSNSNLLSACLLNNSLSPAIYTTNYSNQNYSNPLDICLLYSDGTGYSSLHYSTHSFYSNALDARLFYCYTTNYSNYSNPLNDL
ncbi:Protein CBG21949 [Caenorhabditis briggsae]|uniref:Protein CBG21949 n=1 Tax=Caenorhabditis briggsae TaxID=6238 RepID=A8Y157_CAEBR|nr:Protein CBG21949 [Caenorhabditis briggsae]CAP38618.2 Protein CBG21949 [Caenorhabditis briggsae]